LVNPFLAANSAANFALESAFAIMNFCVYRLTFPVDFAFNFSAQLKLSGTVAQGENRSRAIPFFLRGVAARA
jgi:hypothetical protein